MGKACRDGWIYLRACQNFLIVKKIRIPGKNPGGKNLYIFFLYCDLWSVISAKVSEFCSFSLKVFHIFYRSFGKHTFECLWVLKVIEKKILGTIILTCTTFFSIVNLNISTKTSKFSSLGLKTVKIFFIEF